MAAPEYVPVPPTDDVRAYASPPRRPEPWMARRPGDLVAGQPRGAQLGWQGPDQGYVLVLARRFDDRLHLHAGEHHTDAVAGCVGVALKRASVFGRAPVVHDLSVAFTVWGFLDLSPPAELVEVRCAAFELVSHPLHYVEQRRIVDAVPVATLRMSPAEVAERHRTNWRELLDLDVLAPESPSPEAAAAS